MGNDGLYMNLFSKLIIVVVMLVVFGISIKLQFDIAELKNQKNELDAEVIEISDSFAQLTVHYEKEITDEYIERIAREKYGYCFEGDLLFRNDLE